MSVIAPQGTYVWGRQAPGERPATLLREQELPPSAFNKDQLRPAPGTRQSERRGGKGLYALSSQMGSRRTIPPTPFTPSASAAYTPPVPTRPEEFNLSSRRAFSRGRQPRPYAGLSRRTTQSALAYVASGQTDDLGASGPAGPPPDAQLEPPARDRLSLTQIASAAKSLADATSDTAVMDLMDEARSVAVAINATPPHRGRGRAVARAVRACGRYGFVDRRQRQPPDTGPARPIQTRCGICWEHFQPVVVLLVIVSRPCGDSYD